MGSKRYREWAPSQSFLLPPSPLEWLPEGHLAYFVLEVVGELDLSSIEERIQGKDARGTRPYEPAMMVALLVYAYAVGVFSSRKIARATYEDVAFRVLAGGTHPHFTTINEFRKQHLEALRGLFLQVLKLCQAAGLVKLGHVALDGTKVQANASKHKAMSYERMLKSELQLVEEIKALLKRATDMDAGEDERFGKGQQEEDLPAELQRRESRLATIREAKARLEAEAAQARARALRQQAARAEERSKTSPDVTDRKRAATLATKRAAQARELAPDSDDDDLDPPATGNGLPKHQPNVTTDGKPHAKAQMNFTDADSRIMERGGVFLQGYNCQAAVDEGHQIIVAQAVSNLGSDNGNLLPMLEQVRGNCGRASSTTTADAGYWRPDISAECKRLGTDEYISTTRSKHGQHDARAHSEESVDGGDTPLQAMRAKLETERGRGIYARRKAVVEPVFGQIKEARGFRRFLLRGLDSVQGEWALVCTGHNLLKLWRSHVALPA